MKRFFWLAIFLSFVFKLHSSNDFSIEKRAKRILERNLVTNNIWAISLVKYIDNELTITIFHPFARPFSKKKLKNTTNTLKQKHNLVQKEDILVGKQKSTKTKKYNILQPIGKKNKKLKNKKIKDNNQNNHTDKVKVKNVKKKTNKFNKQYYYDQKMYWRDYPDYDNQDIVFNPIRTLEYKIIMENCIKEDNSNEDKKEEEEEEKEEENQYCDKNYDDIEENFLNKCDKRQQKIYSSRSDKQNLLYFRTHNS